MEPRQPQMQPINPNPSDPQFVPQPVGPEPTKPKMGKKLWILVAGVVGILLILGGLFWFLSKNAKADYSKAVVAYEQQIKEVRDSMNSKLDDNDISIYSVEAPPVFEEYGKKMQDIIASAPKPPKVFIFIPAGSANPKVAELTAAANNYASELRHIYQQFTYYTTMANDFKPIKDLGTFTVFNPDEIKAVPGLWTTFMEKFKALEPLPGLEAFKADLISQGEVMQTKFTELADGFDGRTIGENDDLITVLSDLADAFNQTFVDSATELQNEAIDKVNTYYDELDKLLQ